MEIREGEVETMEWEDEWENRRVGGKSE